MKEEQRLKTIRDILFVLAVVMVGGILLGYFYDCYYDLNDDVLIKDILSGTYTGTPSPMNIQMLYPVGLLISMAYKIVPSLPWYGIFLCTCHFLCIFLLAKRIISFTSGMLKKGLLLLVTVGLFIGLLLSELIFVQYTVTSALLTATGIFLFYTTDDKLEPGVFVRKNIISMCLVILAFYVRTEMMLLLCPLVAAAGIAKWVNGSKKTQSSPFHVQNLIKYLTTVIVVVIGMVVGLVANEIAYRSSEWKEFNSFFDYRTELYDFQVNPPSYEENAVFYNSIGLSEAEEYLLINYNFALDEEIDAQVLSKIVDYNRIYLGKHYFRYNFYEGLREYLYRITHPVDTPWIYLVWMLYGLVFATNVLQKKTGVLWKLILLAGMRSVSWMYLIMRGREVARVSVSLYIGEIVILVAMLIMQTHQFFEEYRQKAVQLREQGEKRAPFIPQYRKYWPHTMAMLLMALTFVPIAREFGEVEAAQEQRETTNREWDLLRGYFMDNPDNYYLLDVYSTVAYSEKMFEDVDNSYRNYDICGGWAAGSPVYMEKLSKRGIGNIQSDLMNMNNVYFVTRIDRDMDWFVAYYKSKGYEVRLDTEACFRIDGEIRFMIYRVRLYRELG